jgi:hypothetical protein
VNHCTDEATEMDETHNDPAYQAGYSTMMRMHAEALRRGWRVPARRIAQEILWLEHSASAPVGKTLAMLERPLYSPAWYRGRAAALREILRRERELS